MFVYLFTCLLFPIYLPCVLVCEANDTLCTLRRLILTLTFMLCVPTAIIVSPLSPHFQPSPICCDINPTVIHLSRVTFLSLFASFPLIIYFVRSFRCVYQPIPSFLVLAKETAIEGSHLVL